MQASTTTGKARLGLVGLGNPCTLGTQLAIGQLGTGGFGATWYATSVYQGTSNFSSAFVLEGGAEYGRWCGIA